MTTFIVPETKPAIRWELSQSQLADLAEQAYGLEGFGGELITDLLSKAIASHLDNLIADPEHLADVLRREHLLTPTQVAYQVAEAIVDYARARDVA